MKKVFILLWTMTTIASAQTASVQVDANGTVLNFQSPSTKAVNFPTGKLTVNGVQITGIEPDASTTVKGVAKLSVAPASPSNPIAVGDNDSRNTNARTPTAHASTHANAGSDPVTLIIGQITGLQGALDLKAPLASPTLTGVPLAPTAAVDTNSTQIATTGFVLAQAANATPIVASTGAVGTSTRYARQDHVHPAQTSVTGNAGTATALQTARTINGTSFDGTANIMVAAAAGTLTGTTLASNVTTSSLLSASGGSFGTAAFTASSAYATSSQGVTTLSLATPNVLYTTPVTFSNASGAWTGTLSLNTQSANTVFAGPTTGSAATPTMRALVLADLPSITSANLRSLLSDENGTGAALFDSATSPTFVTPALGTPSALVLTNATGSPTGISLTKAQLNTIVSDDDPAYLGTANTFTLNQINSYSGTASTPAMKYSGVPFAGTGTTSFPLVYINDNAATASTTLKTAGTYLGVNGHGSQDLMNLMQDGTSKLNCRSDGWLVSTFGMGFPTLYTTGGAVSLGTGVTVFGVNNGISVANNLVVTGGKALLGTTGITEDAAASGLQVNNGTQGQWAYLKLGTRDGGTNTITNGLTLGHQSTGTPAAGLGEAILGNLDSSTTADQNAFRLYYKWSDATHATRTSAFGLQLVNSAAALADVLTVTGAGNVTITGSLAVSGGSVFGGTSGVNTGWYDDGTNLALRGHTSGSIYLQTVAGAKNYAVLYSTGGISLGNGGSDPGDTNVSVTGTLTPVGGIVGTTTNNNAATGNVGQYVSASVVVGSATALTTATPKTVTSISLTAGDWDITAIGALTGASTGTEFDVAIGTTTNSLTGTVLGDTRCQTPTVSLTGADASLMVPAVRVSISSTTTYYLIVQETFTVGSPAAYGRLSARRVR